MQLHKSSTKSNVALSKHSTAPKDFAILNMCLSTEVVLIQMGIFFVNSC